MISCFRLCLGPPNCSFAGSLTVSLTDDVSNDNDSFTDGKERCPKRRRSQTRQQCLDVKTRMEAREPKSEYMYTGLTTNTA